ncbi:zf-HC2 domain-containing protein [Paenibacillus sp. P96]|uniref:Anti-sigma-W factor RsiW n=1 Tax=Paenibacillus zeirhizosphaerae TaxID=2987519 RepID=A0ABT9FQM1_9BACL|nr:zf-HC2 domain-containing protein [Paenibacillus sp. P96]MDP4097024.1 zf-HC2 domain-containing protein [Paenibacillus sp. P96]
MKCEEVMDLMQRYVDHDLDELETLEMMDHIAECPACAEKFHILQALSRELEDLPAVTPKYSLVDAILPQLDAIDEARREQGSALQEMKPVPLQSISGPRQQSKPIPWWNKVAGRAALGVAAAATVLGVVAITYEPKTVQNAEISLMQESSGLEANTHNAGGGSEKTTEQGQADSSADSSNTAHSLEESATSSDIPVTEDKKTGMENVQPEQDETVPSTSQEEEQSTPADSSKESKTEPPKQPATSDSDDSEGASSQPKSEKAPAVEEAPAAEQEPSTADSRTEQDPELETFIAPVEDNSSFPGDESLDATASDTTNGTGADSTASGQKQPSVDSDELRANQLQSDNAEDASSMGMTAQPGPNDTSSTKTFERSANESPDGQYIVAVEGKKLTVYRQSEDDTEKIAIEVRTLNGTWVGGSWSEDSRTFTYSTEQDGTVSNYVYTVPQASE